MRPIISIGSYNWYSDKAKLYQSGRGHLYIVRPNYISWVMQHPSVRADDINWVMQLIQLCDPITSLRLYNLFNCATWAYLLGYSTYTIARPDYFSWIMQHTTVQPDRISWVRRLIHLCDLAVSIGHTTYALLRSNCIGWVRRLIRLCNLAVSIGHTTYTLLRSNCIG